MEKHSPCQAISVDLKYVKKLEICKYPYKAVYIKLNSSESEFGPLCQIVTISEDIVFIQKLVQSSCYRFY